MKPIADLKEPLDKPVEAYKNYKLKRHVDHTLNEVSPACALR